MSDVYKKVAYIGLRGEDGSVVLGVPLYIKLKDVQKDFLFKSEKEKINNITEEMMKRYQVQFGEFIKKKQKENAD